MPRPWSWWQALSTRVSAAQRRARTLSRPPPCTVEQPSPQACSISRGASCVCNQMCINCTIVSQARPRKSVNNQLVPHGGRSSVNPDRIPPSSGSPPAPTQRGASWRLPLQMQPTSRQVPRAWSWWQALSTRVPRTETSTHLESASALHRGAAVVSRPPPCTVKQPPPQACSISRGASWRLALQRQIS